MPRTPNLYCPPAEGLRAGPEAVRAEVDDDTGGGIEVALGMHGGMPLALHLSARSALALAAALEVAAGWVAEQLPAACACGEPVAEAGGRCFGCELEDVRARRAAMRRPVGCAR